ncbi:carbohydrate ABC transporter permease [Paenibacillus sp. Soil724D2]|uniref:carbohydrate ABC transporter permease n=1 Tax=Paenibacillus sp. (strain Soil724D2) TaxID=1736392 RepID=UPI00071258CE|nr:carbohydrate ABC transporter permease [Paenibacillus sp. Soil724D2]KRE36415.1 ABC transporter permease [Paenibacillus sp. Soil724D2]
MNRTTVLEKVFMNFNYIFLIATSLLMLIPFMHIVAGSLSSGLAIDRGDVQLWPSQFTLDNYRAVFSDPNIWRSIGVTVFVTVVGTASNLFFTSLMAFGLTKKDIKGRKFIMLFILFTMIFQAPMIPSYLVVKSLGMIDTVWSLIIPGTISAYNLIIMISFFQNIPEGLVDSAKIDGCGEYRTLFRIVYPLSLPSLSTIGLFYAVSHWNGYYAAMMYIRNPHLYPLQVKLRQLIVQNDAEQMLHNAALLTVQSVEGLKMASIIVATLPILIVYPLIQKHFVKGSMLGSVKG